MKMYLVQIFLIVFGVFLYISTGQQIFPQGQVLINGKTKQNEEDKSNKEPISPNKNPFEATIPKPRRGSSGQITGFSANFSKNINSSQSAVNHNVTSNRTVSLTNYDIQKVDQTPEANTEELTSGAITRGILVFVAFSFLFILYVGIKTYRRKSHDKSRTMVKKYGVRARRSDIEMEPLPLSDDEEDETLFDLTASRGIKS